LEILLLHGGLQETRDERVPDFLADIAGKAGLNDGKRRLAGPKTRQACLTLNCDGRTLGLLVHLSYGDSDIECVLAPFY
jgi:hypothetical protein